MNLDHLVDKNQTIKIVPSVEDSLRATGLNVDLNDNTRLWFQQLKTTWKTWKKSPAIENQIEIFFSSVPDPHRVALVFVIKCEEFKDCKPKTLPFCLLEILLKWSQGAGIAADDSLKIPAFHIAIQQRNQHFLNLVVKTYQVTSKKESILPIVKQMIIEDNCRQASQIVMAMELFDDIPVEDLMFPFVIQDKTNMIDEYLSECPSQIKPFLQFLDKLLDKRFNIREYVQKYLEVHKSCHINYEKLHYKPLGKLAARLCNKFNIPIETCKNLSRNRTVGGLRYLIYQRYQENKVSAPVWDDLVKDSLKQNAESGREFIDMLVDYDRNEALKWAEYLKLAETELPLALKDFTLQDKEVDEENWERTTNPPASQTFYQLSISQENIVIIDTAEKLYDLVLSDLAECNMASIDCEWKPSFGATQSQVALIQIATNNKVYLIDTLVLNKPQFSSFWYTFHKSFLENAEIIKVGFGLEQDLKEVKASIVGLNNVKVKGEGLLDLCLLWRNLIDSGLILPGNSEIAGNSLSSVVQSCFGLPLQKAEQCSNWELRPLRNTQILYAALDAHVLVEIYFYLQKLCLQQDINFEEICNDVMLEGKKKCSKKTKTADKLQVIDNHQPNAAKNIKLLIEPLLSHLAGYFRYCGIDTIIISPTMLWHDVINLAISEDRIILLNKLKCTPTTNFPQSSILDIGKGNIKEQLQMVYTKLNIEVKESDLLSRCLCCNCQDFKNLTANEVLNLCKDYEAAKNVQNCNQRFSDDEDAEYRNFLSDSDCDDDYIQPNSSTSFNNKTCLTSKGAAVDINDVRKLSLSRKPGVLCESCGKFFWDEDPLLQSVVQLVSSVAKLSVS